MLNSPLSGSVKSRFGGSGRSRSKIAAAIAVVISIPFFVSTFAASVTVGSGALTFGQGSQQELHAIRRYTLHLHKNGNQRQHRQIQLQDSSALNL